MALSRGEILEDPKVIGDGTNSGEVRLVDADAVTPEYVALSVPNTLTSTYTIDFPDDIGTAQQVLRIASVASGVATLEWFTFTVAAGGNNTEFQYNNGGSLAGLSTLTTDGTDIDVSTTLTMLSENEFRLESGTTDQYVGLVAPTTMDSGNSTTYTLPNDIGAAGAALIIASGASQTAATLEWGQPTGTNQNASGFTNNNDIGAVQFAIGTTFTGEANQGDFDYDTTNKRLRIGDNGGTGVTIEPTSLVVNGTSSTISCNSSVSAGDVSVNSLGLIQNAGTNGSITLQPSGTGVVLIDDFPLRFGDNGTNHAQFLAPAAIGTSYSVQLPTDIAGDGVPKVMEFSGATNSAAQFVSNRRSLTFNIDSGETGTAIPTGDRGTVYIPINCTVIESSIATTLTGDSASINVYRTLSNSTTSPNTGDIFSGTVLFNLVLSNQTFVRNTGLTQTLDAGDFLKFEVASGTAENVSVTFVIEPRV